MLHIISRILIVFFMLAVAVQAQHHTTSDKEPAGIVDLGEISFPTSGTAEAQAHFVRGVLLLHSFEYDRARRAFTEAKAAEPKFAMAYWGEAMTYNHSIWGEQDRRAAVAALAQLGTTPAERQAAAATTREKLYLAAVELLYTDGDQKQINTAYSNAMGELARRYPDDLEARAFYALSLLGLTGEVRDTENYMRAAAVAEEVYTANRKHPGALHYLIHAYDDPVHAPLGLRVARLYGTVARGASHAQHMPSHIFFALGMWEDSITANTASMKTARDAGTGGYHPLHWLEHAYLQTGRDDEAAKLVAIVEDDTQKNPSAYARTHLAMCRATWLVETRGSGGASMLQPVDSAGINSLDAFAAHDMAIGLAHIQNKDIPAARQALASLRARITAANLTTQGSDEVVTRYSTISKSDIDISSVMERILDASIKFAEGDRDDAIRSITDAGQAEDKLIFEYGPPATVKPAWEAAGEMLLSMGRRTEAIEAFRRVLKRYPNRKLSNEGMKRASLVN
ncbi:MAG: tetratricopeptide repeat protein [Pyrinomonadaceae bacterium]